MKDFQYAAVLTLNFELDLSKVSDDIWHRCRTSVPNLIKNLSEKYQRVYNELN